MKSADRALQILSLFDKERVSLGVSEVAGELGLHKSTASRYLATLAQRGYVRRDGERFVPGLELTRLAEAIDTVGPLVEVARPALDRLAAATGETVNLGIRRGDLALYLSQSDSDHILRVGNWVGRTTSLHGSATGKALLAFSGSTYEGSLERHTERTIVEREGLARDLERTRLRGYAVSRDELEWGLSAMAAPVFTTDGTCRAAVAVSGPSFRLARRVAVIGERCVATAAEIGGHLGARRTA